MEVVTIVLPIISIFLIGFWLKKRFDSDIKTLSAVVFYCLLPALVFKTFYQSHVSAYIGEIILFQLVLTAGLLAVVFLAAKVMGLGERERAGLILGSVFMNAGNYGTPVNMLAFGQAGFDWAITFYVIQSVFMNSFGVFFASWDRGGMKKTLWKVASMPAIWAGVLGFFLKVMGVELAPFVLKPIELLSQGMVPVLMLTLGMQLATMKKFRITGAMSMGVGIRLAISPLLAFGLLYLFPFDELPSKVFLIQAAMPTAVVPTLLAIEYDRDPEMVSSITLCSTLVSVVTLGILLNWLI